MARERALCPRDQRLLNLVFDKAHEGDDLMAEVGWHVIARESLTGLTEQTIGRPKPCKLELAYLAADIHPQ